MGLREFMRFILGQSQIILQSPTVTKFLSDSTGLSVREVYNYLDKLDLKYIRVKWSNCDKRPRAQAIEILRYDVESIPEEKTENAKESSKTTNLRGTVAKLLEDAKTAPIAMNWRVIAKLEPPKVQECSRCKNLKKIHGKNMCGACYQKVRTDDLPEKQCIRCGKLNKLTAKDMCNSCNVAKHIENKKPEICTTCQKEKVIIAKGKCRSCYKKDRYREKTRAQVQNQLA